MAAKILPPALPLALAAFAVLLAPHPGHATLTELVSLGSANYAIEERVSIGTYTQDATGTTFSPSVALGDTIGGTFGPFDWSSFSDLNSHIYLKISFMGANPLLPMTLELFNHDFSLSNLYQGTTTPVAAFPGYFKFDLTSAFTPAVLTDASGAQITWDGGASVNATLLAIASGPEPPPPPAAGGSFTANAPGGFRFITTTATTNLGPSSDFWGNTNGATLPPEASAWLALSDRQAKTEITAIDAREVLRKVTELSVTSWRYRHDPDRRYIGPMAQDFHAAFGLGHDDKHISTLDTDGVTLAALQALLTELRERQVRSAAQAKRLADLEAELQALQKLAQSSLPPAP